MILNIIHVSQGRTHRWPQLAARRALGTGNKWGAQISERYCESRGAVCSDPALSLPLILMHMCIHTHTCAHAHTHICMYTHTYTHIYVHIQACTHRYQCLHLVPYPLSPLPLCHPISPPHYPCAIPTGYLAYAGAGKNSRGTQLIMSFQDNQYLAGVYSALYVFCKCSVRAVRRTCSKHCT